MRAANRSGDPLDQLVGAIRQQLSDRVLDPLDLVMIAADRIQETVDDAVDRGRVTRTDANDLATELVRRGREQTDDVLGDLDGLLGKGIDQLQAVSQRLEQTSARAREVDTVDRLMQGADRARRAAGIGPSFPILGYDALSPEKVKARLDDLSAAELRSVRAYEAGHANRPAIVAAIDRALG